MNPQPIHEIWHVEANGEFLETNFAEMTAWIEQGTLLRQDKVRKGNLRWIEAGKVPSLISVFNAVENGQPVPPIITTTKLEPSQLGAAHYGATSTATPPSSAVVERACSVHDDVPAFYVCKTCSSEFCKACPSSYGGNVRICPFCGALCEPLAKVENADTRESRIQSAISDGFGFGDFAAALAHPFKFKTSLIVGAVMYTIFAIGQSAVSFGGIFMMGSSLLCFLLANMLTVGILTNTVENFTQGKLDANFMPSFDDFSIWDDVVHPFFLSVGVYLSSFGPFIIVAVIALVMISGSAGKGMNGVESDAARTVNPDLPYAANAAKQSEEVRQLLGKAKADQEQRVAMMETGEVPPDGIAAERPHMDPEEQDFEQMSKMIAEQRKAQLESTIGKTPDTVKKERAEMLKQVLSYGLLFIVLGGLTLLWGFFYFPAACAVAGYTRSFMATMNPLVGIDTIRRLGTTYILILVMGFLLAVAAGMFGGLLELVFSPFDMPSVGNLPAKAVGSLFGFYLSVVFSCIIGYALFKTADKLKLYR